MAQPSRRRLFKIGAALPLAAALPAVAEASAAVSPDTELIRICAEHIVNLDTYNRDGGILEPDDDPLALAYERARDAIAVAKPQTVEGLVAKARAAKVEAQGLHGEENAEHFMPAGWAWDLVNDLLRLYGQPAA